MTRPRHLHGIAAWLAMLAILCQALLAGAVQARMLLPSAGLPPGVVEVCTATGTLWLDAEDGTPLPGPAQPSHGKHCPLCTFGGAPALPPGPTTAAFVRTGHHHAHALPAQHAPRAEAHLYATVPPQCGPPLHL
jgi:hypothetical protein